jgi:glutaryl-CoA dehydrogenase
MDLTPRTDTDDASARLPELLAQSRGTDFYGLDELLTAPERRLRDRVREVCDARIAPIASDYWEQARFDPRMVEVYRELGVAGASLRGYDCPGLSVLAEGMIAMELARADGSLATLNAVHSGLAMTSVATLGSPEQRRRWLPPMARMERMGAVALTEPEHGSDVVSMETTARRDGDSWVLTGEKRWIGNGSVADIVVVWARDDDGDVGGFVVDHPGGADEPVPGWHAEVIEGKTANRGLLQAHLRLDGVRLPLDARLEQARTFADTNRVLAKSRQSVAWEAVGHAVAAYEGALTYALHRHQFGRPLARFQLVQDKLSHMVTDITGMQLMCVRMAQLEQRGGCRIEHAAMAKMHCAATARRVCASARDILGGNGILLDHHVARHMADIEATYTYEGTDTVQSLLVGRAVTGMSAFV